MNWTNFLSSFDMPSLNLLGAVALAILSFLLNGQLNRMADRRVAKIRFVESQLKDLYGPLYAITKSNEEIYERFKAENLALVGRIAEGAPLSDSDIQMRNNWNQSVFQPSNLRMRDVIERNAHLFAAETIPDIVLTFLAHVENWQANAHSQRPDEAAVTLTRELVSYPEGFAAYVSHEYERISKRHAKLVGRSRK